jgi:hypothetical protein
LGTVIVEKIVLKFIRLTDDWKYPNTGTYQKQ